VKNASWVYYTISAGANPRNATEIKEGLDGVGIDAIEIA